MNVHSSHFLSLYRSLLLLCLALSAPTASAKSLRKTTNLTRAERAEWRKVLNWPADCERSFQQFYDTGGRKDYGGLNFHGLGRGRYLVEVVCYGGAYQPGSVFAHYDEARPRAARLLKLRGYDGTDDRGRRLPYSEVSGFATFVKKDRVLEVFTKFRGPGDCGQFVRYRFAGGRAVVTEARGEECSDSRIETPTAARRWPRIKL